MVRAPALISDVFFSSNSQWLESHAAFFYIVSFLYSILFHFFNCLPLYWRVNFFHLYAPNFEKVGGILVSACPYVCMYVRTYVCIHVRDIVLKLHVWIPHGKIADAYFWFSLNYLPLSNYGPLTNKGMKFCKCHISKV